MADRSVSSNTDSELPSRDEVLAGLTARRTRTLLYLIESHTARLMLERRRAVNRFLNEDITRDQDVLFFEALSAGSEAELWPTIQDLERFAPDWSALVPADSSLRAALAKLLGGKYRFARKDAPRIVAALGLDDDAVRSQFEQRFGRPLETIFSPEATLRDRLRWLSSSVASRVESLSPFWTAFALTFTETVGVSIVALPIAIAEIGPLSGIALLAFFGVLNVFTVASIAEAATRSGEMRYGNSFFGRLVGDHLGGAGTFILTSSVSILCVLALLACYVGFSTTLAAATGLPAVAWNGLLFAIAVYYLTRESLSSTVVSALIVGAINIGLLLVICAATVGHVRAANLLANPLLEGAPIRPSMLESVFGVVLTSFFGHLSIGNCAKAVLKRDPSGRSLTWGCMAAQGVAIPIYGLWIIVVSGALSPEVLAHEPSTVFAPLSATVGPVIHVLGSIYAILAMGMGSVHLSLALFNLVRERLPRAVAPVLVIPRERASLTMRPRTLSGTPALSLRFVEMRGAKALFTLAIQLRDGTVYRDLTIAEGNRWDLAEVSDPELQLQARKVTLSLEVMKVDDESVRVRVHTLMATAFDGDWRPVGLQAADLLDLPDEERRLVQWLARRGGATLAEAAALGGEDPERIRPRLEALVDRGFVERSGQRYETRFARSRGRRVPAAIWAALGQIEEAPASTKTPETPRPLPGEIFAGLLGRWWRSLVCTAPIVAIFLLSERLLWTNSASFTRTLGFAGVIAGSLFVGVFSTLLLLSTRRKSDLVPGMFFRFLGHPLTLSGVYLLFFGNLLLHALVIWQEPLARLAALFAALSMPALAILALRRSSFTPRLVLRLWQETGEEDRAHYTATVAGEAVSARVRLRYESGEPEREGQDGEIPMFAALRGARFDVDSRDAREMKVWAYRLGALGDPESLPLLLETEYDETPRGRSGHALQAGPVVLPCPQGGVHLDLTRNDSTEAASVR